MPPPPAQEPRSRSAKLQDCLIALGRTPKGSFWSLEELVQRSEALVDDADSAMIGKVIEVAVDSGVLGKVGRHYLLRRVPSHEDFVILLKKDGVQVREREPWPYSQDGGGVSDKETMDIAQVIRDLPSLVGKLNQLQSDVVELRDSRGAHHHWLGLNFEKMPKDVLATLRERAGQAAGLAPSEDDIQRHALLIAARILQNSLRGR